MNEKSYKKRLDFQQKVISHQSEQIEALKLENEKLKLKIQEKDELINSVDSLRNELSYNVEQTTKYRKEYESLINELKQMKKIMNQTVFKGRWKLIRLIMK